MAQIKRYDYWLNGTAFMGMSEVENGTWVKWEDIAPYIKVENLQQSNNSAKLPCVWATADSPKCRSGHFGHGVNVVRNFAARQRKEK